MSDKLIVEYIAGYDTDKVNSSPCGDILYRCSNLPDDGTRFIEYQIYTFNVTIESTRRIRDCNIVTTGFLYTDTLVSDVTNPLSLTLPVPAISNVYNPGWFIAFRYYSRDLEVSDWSDALAFYQNPGLQSITTALYNTENIYLQVLPSTTTIPDTVVASFYYYTDADDGSNVWVVSDVLTMNASGVVEVPIPDNGKPLAADTTYHVTVHAVYRFSSLEGEYFTIGSVSNSVNANPLVLDAPVLDPVDYLVYSTPSSQAMTLTWEAPAASIYPDYYITTYNIYAASANTGTTPLAGAYTRIGTVAGDVLTFSYTLPTVLANLTYWFYVTGTCDNGETTPASNTENENTFAYAGTVTNLTNNWATGALNDDDDFAFSCQWTRPSGTSPYGFGTSPRYHWILYKNVTTTTVISQTPVTTVTSTSIANGDITPNVDPAYIYVLQQTNIVYDDDPNTTYNVVVYVTTLDTNSLNRLNSPSSSTDLVLAEVPEILNMAPLYLGAISFTVTSTLILSLVNELLIDGQSNPMIWYSEGTGVTLTQEDGLFTYNVTISGISGPVTGYTVFAANATGIGSNHYPSLG
jgi:hypothetical protein